MMVAICEKTALFREALATVVTGQWHPVVCCMGFPSPTPFARSRYRADVLLLDASLTDRDSLALLRQTLGLRVLLLTGLGRGTSAAAALGPGLADAVIGPAVALVTLERAVNGQQTSAARPKRAAGQARHADALLTVREREVIALLLAGHSTDAMAVTLGVSRSTVSTCRASCASSAPAADRAVRSTSARRRNSWDDQSFPLGSSQADRRLPWVRLLVGNRLRASEPRAVCRCPTAPPRRQGKALQLHLEREAEEGANEHDESERERVWAWGRR